MNALPFPDLASDATTTLRCQIHTPDPLVLERERVLPPLAAGANGGPYKMLRTQVLRRLEKLNANTLAIIGTAPGTGKTLTAVNLAIAMAAEAERTALLVDLDLRKPSVHARFGITPTVGVDDCLRQQVPLREAMLRVAGYERLVVLPARERCEDSSEMLAARHTHRLVSELRERYQDRIIIFDLPPVLQADDALAFARYVQAGLVVVGEGRTNRDDLRRTLELLRDLPIVGTVLNCSRESVDTYY
ncbi:MAG TPA: CpsD/CapB family tyrosine-protein kinase [Dyella sp.]|uniref:CpsD/CapB family tyrosine-protein kinase n=1 Tax=Dyella sp. TaxID=1869338 RepID=UPI002D77C691|nr:CpsD/CapB family tyrosine-protein kinase [Dyella sp.]HET6553607.1 CpsD/CapB family tyrosine-protein kinase [Dyella sp.]